jgi:hypothetical protein
MKKRYFYLFFIYLFLSFPATAQTRSLQIGGKLINEFTFYNGFAPGFGGQVVYRINKHGGIESGLNYQSRYQSFDIFVQYGSISNTYFTRIAEHWLQLPIHYRYDSKAINFTAGPTVNYFIGWDTKNKANGVTVNDYDRNAVSFAGSVSVSRSLYLSPRLILEPELRFNYIFTDDDGGLALNISLRKKLF